MIQIIAAVDKNGGIGKDNKLLCHLPADLKRFKQRTSGHTIIMGRKTWESLPRVLPRRKHIILTGQHTYKVDNPAVSICHSISELMPLLRAEEDYFIIGGSSLYKAFLSKADVLLLTEIEAVFAADTFFPSIDKRMWHEVQREHFGVDQNHKYAFDFVRYEKRIGKNHNFRHD